MSKAVYISTIEPNTGKSIVSLGLMELLLRKTPKIGYFRPIIKNIAPKKDEHTQLILDYFNLNQKYEDCIVFTGEKVKELLGTGHTEKVIDQIIDQYKKLECHYDFILIEGSDFIGDNLAIEFDLNAQIARNLGSPVLLVGTGKDKEPHEAARNLKVAMDSFIAHECEVIGAIINRVAPEKQVEFDEALHQMLGGTGKKKELTVIPDNELLSSPSVEEIAEQLEAEIIFGQEHIYKKSR